MPRDDVTIRVRFECVEVLRESDAHMLALWTMIALNGAVVGIGVFDPRLESDDEGSHCG